ncbi:MAG TPA: ATP-binding cassette domain-containing protein [Candidatus Absconditabacterales bacterium]|nr:ATP-binding cassette domain-containing protein [Candidatus Absconditabacterales bacterium]
MKQQIHIDNLDDTIYGFLKKYTGIEAVENDVNDLMQKLNDPTLLDLYGEKYELFERMGGYEFDYKAEKVLNEVGLSKYDSKKTKIKNLSGGEKNKLLLSATILKGGDLLLLDEPTNNLDISAIDGLINLLKESLASCLIISHDKAFLNEVVTKVFEIDSGKLTEYSGDYDFYEKEKMQQYENQLLEYQRQQEEYDRMEESKRNLQNKAHVIGNRGNTKDNDKGDGASKVAKKLASQARNIASRIERMKEVEKPKEKKPIEFILETTELPEGKIRIENLTYSYPDNDSFELSVKDLNFNAKDKILITGENGQGKSTFIKLLTNKLGNNGMIEISPSIKIGVFSQDHHELPHNLNSIEFLESQGNYSFETVNYILSKLGFEKEDREKKIPLLSPGMRARLIFSLLSLQKCNCVVFDEPTNHVDIATIKELENAINNFNGMVFVVSHDQKFIDNLSFTRRINFKNGVGSETSI